MSVPKHRGKNWTHLEDEALCRAWLDVSQDAIVGTNQRTENLYERIYEKYVEICATNGVTTQPELRAPSGLKSRWHIINKSVSKFAGCVAQTNARLQSGSSPEDALKNALTLYATKEKTPFAMIHCYRILESSPKWRQYDKAPAGKRSIEQSPTDTSEQIVFEQRQSSTEDNEIQRPRGRNASKQQKIIDSEGLELAKTSKLLAVAAQEKVKDSILRTKALKRMANHSIMSVHLNELSPVAKKFYEIEQRRILEETIKENESENPPVELADTLPLHSHAMEMDIAQCEQFDCIELLGE